MRKNILFLLVLFSVSNITAQKLNNIELINLYAQDSIFEMPVYIPILESEQDSIKYGYKIIGSDTMPLDLEHSLTIEKDTLFISPKVIKPLFPGGDRELLKFIDYFFSPVYSKNLQRNKKYKTGYTTVRFKITKTGYVQDAEILKSCLPEYDEEIKKIIMMIPAYVPSRTRTLEFYCLLSVRYPVRKNSK
ncbi:MAG: energy transducer TonB [Dysgonomonas sp.]